MAYQVHIPGEDDINVEAGSYSFEDDDLVFSTEDGVECGRIIDFRAGSGSSVFVTFEDEGEVE